MTNPDTLTPARALADLEQARTETGEARALAEALAERIRGGDATVTPAQLAEARQLAEFADLRVTAAQRKAEEAAEADRQARARHLAAQARQVADQDDPETLASAVRTLAEAVAGLVAVALPRNDRIRSIGNAVRDLDHELTVAGASRPLSSYGIVRHPEGIIVNSPPTRVVYLSAAELVAAAVRLGTGLRDVTEADVMEAFNHPDATLARVLKAVPALADEWRHSDEEWAAMDRKEQSRAVATRRAPLGASIHEPAL
ncbi:hypothetical protein [Streptomyces sp. NPDC101132]|uniref:hypothetical protein n=1 Tax=Streptomyces sp. NPDC101132 TaxID=3366110 RepID=UPI0037FD80A8